MDNFIFMQKLQSDKDIGNKEFGLFFSKRPFVAKVIAQVTAIKVVHYEIEMLSVLEGVGHIDKEGVGETRKNLFLVHYRSY